MKRFLIIILGITLAINANELVAQQLLHRTQFMLHDFLLNPAAAGSRPRAIIQTGKRSQWLGLGNNDQIDNAFVSFHSPIEAKANRKVHHGMGMHVVNEVYKPFSGQRMMMAYSYHYLLTKDLTVSLGVAAGINQYRVNGNAFLFADNPDPVITGLATGTIHPDMQVGILGYSKKYFFSFNTFQVLKNKVNGAGGGESDLTRLRRHFFFSGGRKFSTGPHGQSLWSVFPSAMITYAPGSPLVINLNIRYIYDDKFWLGLSFRLQDAAAAMIGFNIWRLGVGYSYDYTLSQLRDYSNNSHELILEFRLKDVREKNKPCHAYY